MQSTNEFVHSQNVLHLKRRLSVEADQDRRNVLLTLLAEEEAKLHNGKEKRRRFDQNRFARPRALQPE
jgi:hypothetical protein